MTALLPLAVHAAALAGAELMRRRGDVRGLSAKTSATDPVSDADRAAEALLVATLLEVRPDDAVLGEEGADRAGTSGLRWILDPLDGTVNYLYGLGGWSVSVAAEDADGVVVGVVHDPLAGETFSAQRGEGAWQDGTRLQVNEGVPLAHALVATGFAYDPGHRRHQARIVSEVLPRVRDIRRLGSAALDLCSVAAGRVDAYYEDSTELWDRAAGALIATEAGATVTSLTGPGGHDGVLAAGPGLHGELEALLQTAG